MKLTGENQTTGRLACPSGTLHTTHPTCTALGSNPGLHGDRLVNNRLYQSMAQIQSFHFQISSQMSWPKWIFT